MGNILWNIYDTQFFNETVLAAQHLAECLKQNTGARIGQSTVVSQKIHTYDPSRPEEVQIIQNSDAGQAFYHRKDAGKVCHLDVFHQCGQLDHHVVAAAIKNAVNTYNFNCNLQNFTLTYNKLSPVKADWIDIQTGTGGGRITGSLKFGTKLSLRRAHENHVHIAAMLPLEDIGCLLYIVCAVESVIMETHLEIRRNDKIFHVTGDDNSKVDLSPYADQSDSFLQEKNVGSMSSTVKKHQNIQDTVDLMEHFDTVGDMKNFLEEVALNASLSKLSLYLEGRNNHSEEVIDHMASMGILAINRRQVCLTQYGQEFKEYLTKNIPDIESYMRTLLRCIKPTSVRPGRSKVLLSKMSGGVGHRILKPLLNEDLVGELAVSETVNAAAQRMVEKTGSQGFHISGMDLRHFWRHKKKKTDICLVVDASASMVGQRIKAAKFLARHLLLSTPDRISMVIFQDDWAKVQVPFTRDYRQVEQSLREIVSLGSTPLALGLKVCVGYLQQEKVHNPMIILITDGVPTLADVSGDPMADALTAAQDIKSKNYGFVCIGLKPHKNYLAKLSQAAGGSTYVLDELEKQVLVKAAWAEREEHCL